MQNIIIISDRYLKGHLALIIILDVCDQVGLFKNKDLIIHTYNVCREKFVKYMMIKERYTFLLEEYLG